MPTRVIDVGSSDDSSSGGSIKLVHTNGRSGRYAILSYCWGPIPQLKTTLPLLKQHSQRIDTSQLSQTVQDAIVLTRDLGLRYLWIDALCIIQSLPGEGVTADFLREAPCMKQYYGNAYVAIMVADAERCQDGFLNSTFQPDCQAPIPLGEDHTEAGKPEMSGGSDSVSNTPASLSKPIMAYYRPPDSTNRQTALQGRCWTLQEEYLSRRKLYFHKHLVKYKCQSMFYTDLGEQQFGQSRTKIGPRNPPKRLEEVVAATAQGSALTTTATLTSISINAGVSISWSQANGLHLWYACLKDYSVRAITNRSDAFTALTGLTATFSPVIRSRFLWGIWEADFTRGLLWHRWLNSGRRGDVSPVKWRPDVLPAAPDAVPSWSWAHKNCEKDTILRSGRGSISPELQYRREKEPLFTPETKDAEFLNLAELGDSFDPIREPSKIKGVVDGQGTGENSTLIVRGRLARLSATDERCYHGLATALFSFHNNRRLVRLLRDPGAAGAPPPLSSTESAATPNYTPGFVSVIKPVAMGGGVRPSDAGSQTSKANTSTATNTTTSTSSQQQQQPAEAIAALDDGSYDVYGTEFFCLRITKDLGLLLLPKKSLDGGCDNGGSDGDTFVRVGLFIASNEAYWDALPKRVVRIA